MSLKKPPGRSALPFIRPMTRNVCKQITMHEPLRVRRLETRRAPDALPDFTTTASGVAFRQSFVGIEAAESFCVAPQLSTMRVGVFCRSKSTGQSPGLFMTT